MTEWTSLYLAEHKGEPPSLRFPFEAAGVQALAVGAVRPAGWLRDQCRIQAEGITGRLEEFWPDLGPDNMWLGGKTEGWERGPYYLDGLVPLAYLLEDAKLKALAQKWIDSILEMQDETGWLGPAQAPNRRPYDPWPVAIVLKALTQYHEATEDERVLPVMTRFCGCLRETLEERPLFEWGMYRWADLILSLHWLYERTGETGLLETAQQIQSQGYDWRSHFEQFPSGRRPLQRDAGWTRMSSTMPWGSKPPASGGGSPEMSRIAWASTARWKSSMSIMGRRLGYLQAMSIWQAKIPPGNGTLRSGGVSLLAGRVDRHFRGCGVCRPIGKDRL